MIPSADPTALARLIDTVLPLALTLAALWFAVGSAMEVERRHQRQRARAALIRRVRGLE
jgi:hypothetical protein